MVITTGDTLQVDSNWLKSPPGNLSSTNAQPGLASLERGAILEALARSHGKIYGATGAAAALGLKPTTLYGKMRKHKIPKHPPPV